MLTRQQIQVLKHLLSPAVEENKEIIKSFLNTFVPEFYHDPVKSVEEAPVSIPVLPKEKRRQTFMDMHVISQSGYHYVIEMQARRHINFDERVLYYATVTYGGQIPEEEFEDPMWYKNLKPVIAIQVVGYDSNRARGFKNEKIPDGLLSRVKDNPLPEGKFMKHFLLTDKHSGQELKHLQMIQIELPRARKNLFPPQKDFTITDWWLSIFKFAPHYTHEVIGDLEKKEIIMPTVIAQALERLYFPKWNPQEIHEYKSDTIEKEKYAIEFASEREEGKLEGKLEGIEEKAREIAKELIKEMPLEKAAKLTGLDIEVVRALAEVKTEVGKE